MSDKIVICATAQDENEARIIQAILEGAGIHAIIEGSLLTDEWAVAQRAMGQISSTVKVAASDLERALQVLKESREIGESLTEETEVPDEASD